MALVSKEKPVVDPAAPVLLELMKPLGRYCLQTDPKNSMLFEQGIAYEFTSKDAELMLRLQAPSGLPVFKRWEPKKAKTREVEGEQVRVVPVRSNDFSNEDLLRDGGSVAARRDASLNIGDDDELRSDGIEV